MDFLLFLSSSYTLDMKSDLLNLKGANDVVKFIGKGLPVKAMLSLRKASLCRTGVLMGWI